MLVWINDEGGLFHGKTARLDVYAVFKWKLGLCFFFFLKPFLCAPVCKLKINIQQKRSISPDQANKINIHWTQSPQRSLKKLRWGAMCLLASPNLITMSYTRTHTHTRLVISVIKENWGHFYALLWPNCMYQVGLYRPLLVIMLTLPCNRHLMRLLFWNKRKCRT